MIGKKLLELRKKKGLSQDELANLVGVSRQTISNWELDETSPDLKQIQKLVKVFNVSVDEIIGNENVLLKKVNNTENNSNLIIKLVKVLGVTMGILIFLVLGIIGIIIYSNNYFASESVGSGEGIVCYYNGKIRTYLIMEDVDGKLSYEFDDEEVKSHFDINSYSKPKTLVDDIVKYIKENNGTCLEE